MPKCENCYHYDICIFHGASGCEHCMQYKDKSLIVELPCKVGDTVWMITSQKDSFDDRDYITVIQSAFRLELLNSIGKTIFLTREEAEKALREREKNG